MGCRSKFSTVTLVCSLDLGAPEIASVISVSHDFCGEGGGCWRSVRCESGKLFEAPGGGQAPELGFRAGETRDHVGGRAPILADATYLA